MTRLTHLGAFDLTLSGISKGVSLIALMVAVAGSASAADMPVKAPAAPFFFVNDTSIGFVWYPRATDPGLQGSSDIVPGGVFGTGDKFSRYMTRVDHFDVWEYGTNLFHVELDQYGKQDPSLGIPGAQGSREVFAFGYSTLSFNALDR